MLDLSYCACICRINLFNIEYELLLHTISYVIIKWGYFLLQNEQFLFTLNKRNSDKCIITLIYSITCIKFILYSSYIYCYIICANFFYHLCDETCFAMLSYFVTWPNSSLKLPSCLLSLYFVNHIRTQMLLFAVIFVSAFNCDQG